MSFPRKRLRRTTNDFRHIDGMDRTIRHLDLDALRHQSIRVADVLDFNHDTARKRRRTLVTKPGRLEVCDADGAPLQRNSADIGDTEASVIHARFRNHWTPRQLMNEWRDKCANGCHITRFNRVSLA